MIHCAAHYMDDYYVILPDMEKLRLLAYEIIRRFEAMGIKVNKRKCKLVPLTKSFRFCKAKFTLRETGEVIINGNRDSMKRSNRKLNFFQREYEAGNKTLADVSEYMQSQYAYFNNYDDHGRVLRLRRRFYAKFGGAVTCSKSLTQKPGPVSA